MTRLFLAMLALLATVFALKVRRDAVAWQRATSDQTTPGPRFDPRPPGMYGRRDGNYAS